jgi:signal peptidase I
MGAKRARPSWRALAFVSSLTTPGSGHLLRGNNQRGLVWAAAVTGLGMALLLAVPISFSTITILVAIFALASLAGAIDTLRLTDRRPPWKSTLASWAVLLTLSGLVGGPFASYYQTHYLRAFTIPSGSMEPAVARGDFVLTNNSVYRADGPRRGDIIVFRYPPDERREFVKRVVGLPGERLEMRANQVLVNGRVLDEPYVMPSAAAPLLIDPASCGYRVGCNPTVVPADSYFVLGDNRENSQDSRHWGFVRRDKIVGRVFAIYWSWDPELHRPRLSRVGQAF